MASMCSSSPMRFKRNWKLPKGVCAFSYKHERRFLRDTLNTHATIRANGTFFSHKCECVEPTCAHTSKDLTQNRLFGHTRLPDCSVCHLYCEIIYRHSDEQTVTILRTQPCSVYTKRMPSTPAPHIARQFFIFGHREIGFRRINKRNFFSFLL